MVLLKFIWCSVFMLCSATTNLSSWYTHVLHTLIIAHLDPSAQLTLCCIHTGYSMCLRSQDQGHLSLVSKNEYSFFVGAYIVLMLINESIKPSTQQFLYNKHSYNEICLFTYHSMFRSISWPSSGGSAYVKTFVTELLLWIQVVSFVE
jgi:hypothetical protein